MLKPRYLTKSRYKLALECPTKLFYTGKKDLYHNSKDDDLLMQSLADKGNQVGELAKHYFLGGVDVISLDYEEAESMTNQLLEQDKVIIYEPAIRFNNLFIRIDILVKDGDHFDLIEVKSKAYDSIHPPVFLKDDGTQGGGWNDWKGHLYDVAFQNHVLSNKFPAASINSYLMTPDKYAKCATNGLNQKFPITIDDDGRRGVSVHSSLASDDLELPILVQFPVDQAVEHIQNQSYDSNRIFTEEVRFIAENYENDSKVESGIGGKCKSCEFSYSGKSANSSLRSGFRECWADSLGWSDDDFNQPNILDVWDLHFQTKDKLFRQGKIKLSDLSLTDINIKQSTQPGLSKSQRQWIQINKTLKGDKDYYFDERGFNDEKKLWTYPLHFIDFETAASPIPYTKGRRPNETIAFQFSHHSYYQDGRIEHTGEYINTERNVFPNFDFLRELKSQLEGDEGTIFRYAAHENTILKQIKLQLEESLDQPDDSKSLISFIDKITTTPKGEPDGKREMVDMLELVKRYYYDPDMGGSNSLKEVLPSILNQSKFLQDKYSHAIYGAGCEILSLNFPSGWVWIEKENGSVKDPYKTLPKPIINGAPEDLNNGGAAMTAYARLQSDELSAKDKDELKAALLNYCELDTLAMVMLFEGWQEMPDAK
jgi:hypothetical protein